MTTDDEPVDDDLVDHLFREVDDQFNDLERQYQRARADLTSPLDVAPSTEPIDPVAASAARFELVTEVAELRADLSRRAEDLDERDRLLVEMSDRIVGFETELAAGRAAERDLQAARQQLHDERRELTRVQALLDASAAERHELADVAHRLQKDKEHIEGLLATAIERFDQVDRVRAEVSEKLARLEAARQAEAAEHESRQGQLVDAKAELRRLTELVDELGVARDEATKRADQSESRVERRANEVKYLNRRIESLNDRATEAEALEAQVTSLQEERALLKRQVGDLTRSLESETARAAASAAAVDAIADRSSRHEDLLARIAELEASAEQQAQVQAQAEAESGDEPQDSELRDLVERARQMGRRRAEDYDPVAQDYEPVADAAAIQVPTADQVDQVVPVAELLPAVDPAVQDPAVQEPAVQEPAVQEPAVQEPAVQEPAVQEPAVQEPAVQEPAVQEPVDLDLTVGSHAEASVQGVDAARVQPGTPAQAAQAAPALSLGGAVFADATGARRQRLVLPTTMQPDTDDAVTHLLGQRGAVAVVDARSSCARTGIRPSELFERIGRLRDRFDLPVEVVVTPVSTPVGGAPQMLAVGVHLVTGADTVADRIRALCLGFPNDQQIVVIAGDDHVRQAAIAEEANVVDPAVAFGLD